MWRPDVAFYFIFRDSVSTCHNSLSDVQETVNLLVKGVWTLNLLEDLARHKAPQ